MKTLYIGGSSHKKNSSSHWKLYLCLILFLGIIGVTLKFTGSIIVERWINQQGARSSGYAFSVRDVELSLSQGQITLKDMKVFNPKTSSELLEAPEVKLQVNLNDLILSNDKKISFHTDQADLFVSKDLSSEIQRIKEVVEKEDLYLNVLDGKITRLNVIEKKDDQSRTMIELNNVNLKIKDVGLLAINKKSEFSISSNVADAGKLNLAGKIKEENGSSSWIVTGSLKQVPSDIFNKIAGDKLPFSFFEPTLNAEINALSENGIIVGEITPEVKRLNLIVEKPGVATQSIARALNDDLSFSLPFTLKDEMKFQYVDTYTKLKTYRKYPAAETPSITKTQGAADKSFSLWPF